MSWSQWTEQGYGIPLGDIESIKKFLIEREPNNEIIAKLREAEDEMDLEDIYGDPPAWYIAGLIRNETGYSSLIGFMGCGDTDFESHIGFTPDLPWVFKGKDKELTQETADKILRKYAKELGVDDKPGYFTAEYCG